MSTKPEIWHKYNYHVKINDEDFRIIEQLKSIGWEIFWHGDILDSIDEQHIGMQANNDNFDI